MFTETHIAIFLLLAFFLQGIAQCMIEIYKLKITQSKNQLKITDWMQLFDFAYISDASFAFVTIALFLSIVRTFSVRTRKMFIVTFTLLAIFFYAYAIWCATCQRSDSDIEFDTERMNLVIASLAFISIAMFLMILKMVKKE